PPGRALLPLSRPGEAEGRTATRHARRRAPRRRVGAGRRAWQAVREPAGAGGPVHRRGSADAAEPPTRAGTGRGPGKVGGTRRPGPGAPTGRRGRGAGVGCDPEGTTRLVEPPPRRQISSPGCRG